MWWPITNYTLPCTKYIIPNTHSVYQVLHPWNQIPLPMYWIRHKKVLNMPSLLTNTLSQESNKPSQISNTLNVISCRFVTKLFLSQKMFRLQNALASESYKYQVWARVAQVFSWLFKLICNGILFKANVMLLTTHLKSDFNLFNWIICQQSNISPAFFVSSFFARR